MEIKVYNENGIVKITKIVNGRESSMFSDLKEGESISIKIMSNISYEARKNKITGVEDEIS